MEFFNITDDGKLLNKPEKQFFSELKELYLGYIKLTDTSTVTFPPKLEVLYLGGNYLRNVSGIVFPQKLQELHLNSNSLRDISGVVFPQKLQELDLWNNYLTDISAVTFPPKLEVLYLGGNYLIHILGFSPYFKFEYIEVCRKIRIIQRFVRKWFWKRKRKNSIVSWYVFEIGYDMNYVHCYMAKKGLKRFKRVSLIKSYL